MLFGRTKAASAFMRGCKIYFSEQRQVALVAPMVNHAGLFAERPGAVVEASIRDAAELGQATRAALEGCLAVGTVSAGGADSELGQCVLAVWESHRQLREGRPAGPAA